MLSCLLDPSNFLSVLSSISSVSLNKKTHLEAKTKKSRYTQNNFSLHKFHCVKILLYDHVFHIERVSAAKKRMFESGKSLF